jgi:hypothetical protein
MNESRCGIGRAVVDVDVVPGRETRLDLKLECGRALSVTAVDGEGNGVKGAVVTIRDPEGREVLVDSPDRRAWYAAQEEDVPPTWAEYERTLRTTNHRGFVRIRPVPPGEYRLEIAAPDGRRAAAGVTVKESGYARVTVTLE